jgi:hypothetical protein
MAVSGFERQVESTLAGVLTPYEKVLQQGNGSDGLKPCVVVPGLWT